MKNSQKILIVVGVVILVAGILALIWKMTPSMETASAQNLVGCYEAHVDQDVYSLRIQSQDANTVSGTLAFKNFQKDSSSGTFTGTYKDDVLVGDYTFQSEGLSSVMQVAFKKSGDDLIRGVGDMGQEGVRFTNVQDILYDASSPLHVFKKVTCPAVSATQIIFPAGGEALHAGNPYTLMWQGAQGETLALFLIDTSLKSAGASVSIVDRLYGVPNTGSYVYTFPKNLNAGVYELQIGDGVSNPFKIVSK